MTTIAWDGEVLAADRLANASGLRRSTKKIFDCGEYWYAGCGTAHEIQMIARWILNGAKPDGKPTLEEGGGWGLAVHKGTARAYHVLGKNVELVEYTDRQQADGSGRDFAIAAMSNGMGAVDAIRFAARFDLNTGDGVDFVEVRAER